MKEFSIDLKCPSAGWSESIAMRCGDITLTQLLRPEQAEPDDYLHASADQLAIWFISNWWRLTSECRFDEPNAEWRMANGEWHMIWRPWAEATHGHDSRSGLTETAFA
jgi:hypothetical protein